MFNYQRLMFKAPITTPHTALLRTAKLSKKSLKVLLRHPPFEGSPRAGAAEYVLRGDVNNQLVTKIFCSLISLF